MMQDEDPVAIVGMACRLPGDIKCPSDLWKLLQTGRSAQSDVPANRFSVNTWYHPDASRNGSILARGGYFLSEDESFRDFEPSFFGINPVEAASMDPQQRKLLEIVYETFESAGVTIDQISGSLTACYVGAFTRDFNRCISRDLQQHFPYESTGSDMTILSNRVNYVFNLKGPSLTVDTACSSSLYALHLAWQGLLLGDFKAAIVAGTNIIMDVSHQLTATKLGILSPTSTCHTFDAQADGFGRAEGITALYLKRLSDAVANGDPIRGIIRGSAINTNGRGLGISHPSTSGQEAVIRQAYSKAGLKLEQTTYVECHGTGTPVGDPTEVSAVGNAFGTGRTPSEPLLLSGLKSQIGHTEGASGIAAVQKVVLSLENGVVPATIGIIRVNPEINLRNGSLKIVQTAEQWPHYAPYLRASINSFGYGGANAHLVIDSTQSYFLQQRVAIQPNFTFLKRLNHAENHNKDDDQLSDSVKLTSLLISSAKSLVSLRRNIVAISSHAILSRCSLQDLAYTVAAKRTRYRHRAFAIASTGAVQSNLEEAKWIIDEPKVPTPQVAFVFTGQGAQWPRMGLELGQNFEVVRQTFDTLQEDLNSIPERPAWALYDALCRPASTSQMMTEVTVTVTLCTAVQIALVNLFRSWSVHPIAVVGHSSGEAAAAYCTGHLTMKEAIITSYYRALAMKRNLVPGMMMAVGLGAEEVSQYLHEKNRTVYLACQNSPQSVTLSGDVKSIEELETQLKQAGVFARKIKSSGFANHSPFVETAARYFQQNFQHGLPSEQDMALRTSRIPMYSCITGDKVASRDVGIEYWARNISAPVLFDQALQRLLTVETAVNIVIEIGPHSALSGPIRQIKKLLDFDNQRLSYLPSLIRGNDGVEDVLRLAGSLFTADYPIDIVAVNSARVITKNVIKPRHIVDLPFYQWNYDQVHWAEPRLSREIRFRKHSRHDLLGSLEPSSTSTSLVWRNRLQLSNLPWLGDHKIGQSILLPFSGFIAMAIEAVQQSADNVGHVVTKITLWNVSIMSPVVVTKDEAVEIVFELQIIDNKIGLARRFYFTVSSVSSEGNWRQHSTGSLAYEEKTQVVPRIRAESIAKKGSIQSSKDFYTKLRGLGLNYGPCFQTLQSVHELRERAVKANINMKPTRNIMDHESRYMIHPATMDGCLQVASAATLSESPGNVLRSYLPSQIISMSIYPNESGEIGDVGCVRSQTKIGGLRSYEANCQLHQDDGRILCTIETRFNAVEGLNLDDERKARPEPYQRSRWLPDIDRLQGSLGEKEFLELHDRSLLGLSDPRRDHPAEQPVEDHIRLACFQKLVHLIVFKRPNLSILETGYGRASSSVVALRSTNSGARNQLYRTFTVARARSGLINEIAALQGDDQDVRRLLIDFERDWGAQGLDPKSFDLVIVSIASIDGFSDLIKNCRASLNLGGQLVVFQETKIPNLSFDCLHSELLEAGFSGVRFAVGDMTVVLSVANTEQGLARHTLTQDVPKDVYLVYISNSRLVNSIRSMALDMGFNPISISLSEIACLPHSARTLALMELEEPVISGLDEALLSGIKTLFGLASSVIWITSRGRPEYSLILGMAQVIRTEMPALQLTCLEVQTNQDDFSRNAKAIMLYEATLRAGFGQNENHVILHNGVLYISRYVVDEDLNRYEVLRTRGAIEYGTYTPGLCLDMRKIGDPETSFLKEGPISSETVDQGFVRVTPLIHSLSRQNAMTLRGLNHAHYFSHECFGRVEKVSPKSTFKKGAFVVCLAGTRMNSEIDVREDLCIPCETEQQGEELLGLLEPLCKAWNAIMNLGRLANGKVLLVHSNDLLLNLVAGAIAQTLGAKILITQKADLETNALKMRLRLNDQAFVDLSSPEFLFSQLSDNLDVVFDTEGDLDLNSIEHILAPNCQIIKTDAAAQNAYSSLYPGIVSNGVTLAVFDMMTMAEKSVKIVADLIREGVNWLQTHGVHMPKLFLHEFGTLSKAVTDASNPQLGQRFAIRWNTEAMVPIYRARESSLRFPNDGVYLLVGCLGGLGRCLSLWMQGLGARNFIFLSRTAEDKSEAASLVCTLRERRGVSVKVIRGDVSNREDVQRAVAAGEGHLRGIIQAAGVFKDFRFSSTDLQQWNAVLHPKVQGTANLHEETIGQPLDFFVMTSSSIGVVGASSQSAYAAANTYLDNMARYRQQNGLPATSLSLGMVVGVGHVEEEAGLEAILRRRGGSYGISEIEFLRMMEVAIQCQQAPLSKDRVKMDSGVDSSLIVTGLDPSRLSSSGSQRLIEEEARFSHIRRAMAQNCQKGPEPSSGTRSESAEFELLKVLRESDTSNDGAKHSALQDCVLQKLSSLIMISTEQLRDSLDRPLENLGLDSIVGSEFQAWAWRELRVQLDFMEVFASGRSLRSLVDLINAGLSQLQLPKINTDP